MGSDLNSGGRFRPEPGGGGSGGIGVGPEPGGKGDGVSGVGPEAALEGVGATGLDVRLCPHWPPFPCHFFTSNLLIFI